MILWLTLALMAAGVVAVLVVPTLRRRADTVISPQDFDVAVYKDQLVEVDRDIERGHITTEEAGTVRLEIQRRLLAAADSVHIAGSETPRRSAVVIILALLIPVFSGVVYFEIGSPGTPDFPYAERDDISTAAQGAGDLNDMLAGLKARLAANPNDPEGWALLGRTYQVSENYNDAAGAFLKLYDLTGDVRAQSEYAEALILSNDAIVSADIVPLLNEILQEDPLDPKARFYLGIGMAQQGNLPGAIQFWIDLVHLSPVDAPWLSTVQAQIEDAAGSSGIDLATMLPSPDVQTLAIEAGIGTGVTASVPGPSAEDIEDAAAMSDEDQMSMIRSMVQRLADRLDENPEDPEGWERLIQAYEVLGEAEKATSAREAAKPYLP